MFPSKFLSVALMAGAMLEATAGGGAPIRDVSDGSVAVWQELRAGERVIALDGYEDCAASLPRSVDLAWDVTKQAVRVDKKAAAAANMPALLYSMRNDSSAGAPDPHAEHTGGKYGFHNGSWWSELDDGQRVAYMRGAAWCSVAYKARGADEFTSGDAAAMVAKLNGWFGVDKSQAAVDVSGTHAEMPVYVALRKAGLLKRGAGSRR